MPKKSSGTLFPASMIAKAQANVAAYPWAQAMQKEIAGNAARWLEMSDDDLWALIFGATIPRSWMVWSDGFCPSCKKDVKMYAWVADPWAFPWKVQCPQCKELFPKNDFVAFYHSGLDEHGVFQPDRVDRSLLFNKAHPDAADPLRAFGVDDGTGYVDAENHRWRFISCYLIYGQWKKGIVAGATNLSNAYLATGDPRYARKTAILLDRIADVFPAFDFGAQGCVYEGRVSGKLRGQVSTWHDACEEVRELALAYDRVFESARAQEADLAAFLGKKSETYKLDNPKKTWADIQRNIEDRIFRDTLAHRERIESNYPTTDRTMLILKTILDWPGNRDEVMALLDAILDKATAVDGVSGEKGLAGYTTISPRTVAELLALFARLEPNFLRTIYERHPRLHASYRFHLDTWCMERFYPHSGDSGGFGTEVPHYAGITFSKNPGTNPSMFTFLWDFQELTKDPAFVQVIHRENGQTLDDLPHDLFADDPAAFQAKVKEIIDKTSVEIPLGSVNKQEWHLAILRSGAAENRRALWIDYDANERHSHADGMNIGLFAKGLDLIPEFGYPPVGYGGWEAPKAVWYTKTAAHVTVVVDGNDQRRVGNGATKLWADGQRFRAIRVSDPTLIGGSRYERFVALVDLDDRDSYVLDAFWVAGGKDHAKFFHSFFGAVETQGLELKDVPSRTPPPRSQVQLGNETEGEGSSRSQVELGNEKNEKSLGNEDVGHAFQSEMRNFRRNEKAAPGWSVDWTIEDRYKYLAEPKNIHLRYTDLTNGADAYLGEAWVDAGQQYGGSGGTYVPCVMTRRTAADTNPLASTFAAVIEPYEGQRNLTALRRVPLTTPDGASLPDAAIGLVIERRDGKKDLCIIADPETTPEAIEPTQAMHLSGALGFVTLGANGPERIVLCQGAKLEAGPVALALKTPAEFIEIVFADDGAKVVSGDPNNIASLTRNGTPLAVLTTP